MDVILKKQRKNRVAHDQIPPRFPKGGYKFKSLPPSYYLKFARKAVMQKKECQRMLKYATPCLTWPNKQEKDQVPNGLPRTECCVMRC